MSGFERILFPTDLSPAADAVLGHAGFLADAVGARLVLFHVAGIPPSEYAAWGAGREAEVMARVDAVAREALDSRGARLGVPCEIVVRHDLPSARVLVDLSVLEQIHRTRPDLVIMPTRTRGGFARSFVGSVTEEVVRHAGVPVLAIHDPAGRPPAPYRVVLVATDLSPASRTVFPAAALLGARFGARITVVHATHPRAAVAAEAADVRAFVRPDFESSTVHVATAVPWRAIVRAAELEQADVIAIARQGADSLGEAILGTTTDHVLRHAPCPVLVG
jgi:nucleotide-binding universal stress UspA family protein